MKNVVATMEKTFSLLLESQDCKRTAIDDAKDAADFRLIAVCPNVIRWRDGKTETATNRQLQKLEVEHPNWRTDF